MGSLLMYISHMYAYNFIKMKRTLFIFLLFPIALFGQHAFYKVPIKNKVTSYTVSSVSGDSLNPKLEVVEKVIYDNKGRLLTSYKKDSSFGASANQELNVYKGNQINNYRCDCEDINEFAKVFVIRDNAELKNIPRTYTSHAPTKFVAITINNSKENTSIVSNYSEAGYKVSEIRYAYNTAGNPIMVERLNIDGKLIEKQLNTYDKKERVVSQIVKCADEPEEKYTWIFEDGQNYKESMQYRSGALVSHIKYSVVPEANQKIFWVHNMLADQSYIEKRVHFDGAGREIKVVNINSDQSVQSVHEYSYDERGALKTYRIYNKDNVLSTGYAYKNDTKCNAIGVKVTQLVNERVGNEAFQKYYTSEYIRDIKYAK
jgi:hypothetical protein